MKTNNLEELIIESLKDGKSIYFDPWGPERFRISVRRTVNERFDARSMECDYQAMDKEKNFIYNLLNKVKLMFN